MQSHEPIVPYQLINNVLDLAQLALANRPTLDDLINEHKGKEFEIYLIAKVINVHIYNKGFTFNIDNKNYMVAQFGDHDVYVNEELINESYTVYPIFANNDYYIGCVFDNKDEAIESTEFLNKLLKGLDTYIMMRELHQMRMKKK